MKKILFPSANGNIFIYSDEVSHLVSEGEKYCWLFMTSGKRKLIHSSICTILELLPSPPFYQVNDTSIVHINQVKKIITDGQPQLELASGFSIPISNQLISELFQ